jgi:amino acid adenylation domain-containing protein
MQLEQLLKKLRELKINLSLDGEQLVCRAPKGVMTKELSTEITEYKTQILEFLKSAAQQSAVLSKKILKTDDSTPPILSFGQSRLWFLCELEGPSATYNMPLCLKITGNFELPYFEKALNTIIARHESLRYNFVKTAEGPKVVIATEKHCAVNLIEISNDSSKNLNVIISQINQSSFDLSSDLLLRATVIRTEPNTCFVVILMHHIIADGWSIDVLFNELKGIYASLAKKQPLHLPSLEIQYSDYAKWQDSELQGARLQELANYWKVHLAGCPDFISLRTDFPRPNYPTYRGGNFKKSLDFSLTKALKQLGQSSNCTLFMTLLAGFSILLSTHSNQEDLVIGSPVANRNQSDLENLIGLFINTLPLRVDVSGNPTVLELLERVKRICINGFGNQEIPFEKIVEEINPTRSLNYSPLYQVAFDIQNLNQDGSSFDGLQIETLNPENNSAKFDLSLTIQDEGDQLICLWNYSSDLFLAETIATFAERLESILTQMVSNPEMSIHEISLLDQKESAHLLDQEKNTHFDLPENAHIVDLIASNAQAMPDKIALRFGSQSLTYAQLDQQSSKLALDLIQLGAGPEKLVALLVNRSVEMVVALIAILKSGSAYIPIDPNFPAERLSWILEDASPLLTITEPDLEHKIDANSTKIVLINELLKASNNAQTSSRVWNLNPLNLAYVIFTSGSTGRPKGVQVSHKALYNFLRSMQVEPGFSAHDKLLAVTTISFDIAGLELFLPLISGGEVVIASREISIDGRELQKALIQNGITVMQATPTTWRVLLETAWQPMSPFVALCGGEALPSNLSQSLISLGINLWNLYGPTETTIWSAVKSIEHTSNKLNGVEPIGKPIFNTELYVLNPQFQLLPPKLPGELFIGGEGLARGYLNRPALTALSYRPNPFSNKPGQRLYGTGDLVSRNTDDTIEFLGRKDHQIKIRGYRIEIGEIEAYIREHDNTDDAVVIAKGDNLHGDMRLIAYIVPKDFKLYSEVTLRKHLKKTLPEYMVPAQMVALETFPLTPNGKIDRKALPEPKGFEPANEGHTSTPNKPTEQLIRKIWQEALGLSQINVDDNFFDLGGHSLLLTRVNEELRAQLNRDIPLIKLFEHPTIRSLSSWLDQGADSEPNRKINTSKSKLPTDDAIAIIGIAGRFPGADDVDSFWQNLKEGKESIRFFSEEELVEAGIEPELIASPNYIRGTGVLSNVTDFDAEFFSYTPAEAKFIDPQQRLFLETAWQALENGGYASPENNSIGVFAGVGHNDYLIRNIVPHVQNGNDTSIFQLIIGNDKDFLATRVSYAFNLTGPSITLQTACSTSLVAIHSACRSLMNGECEMALAGGVAIKVPHTSGYIHEQGMISSEDGHCRAFDADANGTVWGSGAGAVLLKPLQKAIDDRDTIHAVIKGSAINNDGSSKVGFTAPSVSGQVDVINQALLNANVSAQTVDYIETHGTGTDLGDLIEVTALKEVFSSASSSSNQCVLGAVKTNIGHLNTAAGIAGLTKAVLALQHKQIPPTLHFKKPNPKLGLENSPFYVSNKLVDWPSNNRPRRAGVSSFGIGGTNAHLILEESLTEHRSYSYRPWQIISLSAQSPNALAASKAQLKQYVANHADLKLEDIAYTLGVGRKAFAYRATYVCQSTEQLLVDLGRTANVADSANHLKNGETPRAVFLFPGQGTQYLGMGHSLYQTEALYRETIDYCAQYLLPILKVDLRDFINNDVDTEGQSDQIHETWITQPLLFITEYALAKLWMSWGIKPFAMIGHSLGEYVAACVSGVFDLDTALSLVAHRGRLMWSAPLGSMLAIGQDVSAFDLSSYPDLSIATINSASSFVVAGPDASINDLSTDLGKRNIACSKLQTSHAFHSRMMDPVLSEFKTVLDQYQFSNPNIPFISNLTGTWITAEQAKNSQYWVDHLRSTVQFSQGLQTLLSEENIVFLEVGPKAVLSSLARKSQSAQNNRGVISTLDIDRITEDKSIYVAVSKAWELGLPLSWERHYAQEQLSRIPLPTYPFERKRHWIDAPAPGAYKSLNKPSGRRPLDEWFYLPHWRPTITPKSLDLGIFKNEKRVWLVFANNSELCHKTIQYLRELNQEVIVVNAGNQFEKLDANTFTLATLQDADYIALLEDLQNCSIYKILHFWLLDEQPSSSKHTQALDDFQRYQALGFHALISISKALAQLVPADKPIDITVIANRLHDVYGSGASAPGKATIIGPSLVIPQEVPQIKVHCLDLDPLDLSELKQTETIRRILTECENGSIDPMVAYRGNQRMVPSYQQVELKHEPNTKQYLQDDGVYLITGGLGKVGLLIGQYLRDKVNANLCLISRTKLPPRETWSDICQKESPLKEILEAILGIEKSGSQVLILSADIADSASLENAFSTCLQRFGKIDGVFHAAGLPSLVTPFLELSPTIVEAHYAAKVIGTYALGDVIAKHSIEFCCLISSTSAVLGGLGYAAYSASNIFMDHFAAQENHNRTGTRWVSINWDAWNFANASAKTSQQGLELSMSPAESMEALDRVLAQLPSGRIIVATGDLESRFKNWVIREDWDKESEQDSSEQHSRPNLDSPYEAPRNSSELLLAEIWQSLLGYSDIGVHDNFFELGGDSMLAIRLMSAIKVKFERQLPLTTLLDNPTIKKLAEVLSLSATDAKESPLVAIQPKGTLPPLFCAPGTGGSVIYLRSLANELAQWDRPFYGLQAIRSPETNKPIQDISEIARLNIEALQTIQAKGPYYLCGHSFGSWVALEMALQLQNAGHEVAQLIILDTGIPSEKDLSRVANWDDSEWLMIISKTIGDTYNQNLNISLEDLHGLAWDDQVQLLFSKMNENGLIDEHSGLADVRSLVEIYKAQAQTLYEPLPFKLKRLALIRAETVLDGFLEGMPLEMQNDPVWGWAKFSQESPTLEYVLGNHLTMVQMPNAKDLAAKMNTLLQRSET